MPDVGVISLNWSLLAALAHDRNIGGETYRVLYYMLSKIDITGAAKINQTALAKVLGIQRSTVAKSLRLLVEKGVFAKEELAASEILRTYKLNSMYGMVEVEHTYG